tara:strand:- start:1518 stop:2594 length:1077 start_codon:yes stop_codon:yes gene_type:complete
LIVKKPKEYKLKLNPIQIGKRLVGEGNPCYIIAEIGSNFDGNLNLAKKLIKEAKKAGADAAKFQSFQVEKILSKKGFEKKVSFQNSWTKSVWNVYKDAELPLEWIHELSKYAKKCKIDFLSAPYHVEAVDELVNSKVPAIKIGSGEITNLEFLEYIAKTKKPILLATGASTQKDVDVAVKKISKINKNLILMQATTQYPSPIKDANLRVIDTFRKKYGINVGYSDHTPGITCILGSIALGACTVEKHFTLDNASAGPDHNHSLDVNQFAEMVKQIRYMETALGNNKKNIEKSENQTKIIQRRGIWTSKKILKGEKFSSSNVNVLRPCIGISASKFKDILGKRAKRNLAKNSAIKANDL